ncbi:MAG: hypothetical protein K9H61_03105 [Bacteroidia bacterium]|nr:hypothetical protein [Bacteroidia bacterium]MCF8426699.1 hypothetical protein [Bacteroidia bacterium]MCF8445961.1 hypothetical protein [Bacteroidia bacterium]
MSFESEFSNFWEKVKESLNNRTFAKLTLAKTIGDTDLKNVYMRVEEKGDELIFVLLFRHKTKELEMVHTLDEAYPILLSYMNNPFLTALLFTTENDITFKLNKKRVGSIIIQDPTFKNSAFE